MPEKHADSNETRESSVSRWILFGGVFVLVVSVCLLFAGAFIAQRDRGYETESLSDPHTEDSLAEAEDHDHDYEHESGTHSSSTALTAGANSGNPSTSASDEAGEETKSLLSDPSVMWEHVAEEGVDESEMPDFPRGRKQSSASTHEFQCVDYDRRPQSSIPNPTA